MNLKRLRGYTRLGEVRKVHLGHKKYMTLKKMKKGHLGNSDWLHRSVALKHPHACALGKLCKNAKIIDERLTFRLISDFHEKKR